MQSTGAFLYIGLRWLALYNIGLCCNIKTSIQKKEKKTDKLYTITCVGEEGQW